MMNSYERADIVHIMKMNRFTLSDADTAQLDQVRGKDYQVTILVVEDLPRVSVKRDGEVVFSDTVKSVDELKIFFEEHPYKYLEV